MNFIRAVITLSFTLLLYVSASVSSAVPVPYGTAFAGACQVVSGGEVNNGTAIAGVFLASYDSLKEAQRISVEETQVQMVAASEEIEEEVEEPVEEPSLEENADVIALACLIQGEGANLSFNERVAIALTACYRTDMSEWPDSIQGNIYKANQYAPASHYNDSSLEAAEHAYTLWKEGRGGEVLPSEYYSFFGNGSHNYFYNKSLQIYSMPGVPMPGDIYDQMTQIIPALRRAVEQEVEETAESPETEDGSIEEEQTLDSEAATYDNVQSETPNIIENNLENAVSQNVSEEQVVSENSGSSEITTDLGENVTAE